MDDQESEEKIQELVTLFAQPIRSFIEIFVVGKRNKNLRNASTHFVKGLWECAERYETKSKIQEGNSLKIFNAILSVPMQSTSASLISYILKQKGNTSLEKRNSSFKMHDVFQFIKKSLSRANDLIFSHQNLELYSNIYYLVSKNKGSSNPFGGISASKDYSGSSGVSNNIFIFEREPCMKCYPGQPEDFIHQQVNDIKSDMKSNDQSQVYKLSSPMKIKEIILNAYDLKGTKRVSEVSIYTNNSQKVDLSAIKRDKSVWTFIMTMKVSEGKGEKKCKFPVPITACNLMFEFHVVNSNKTTTSSTSNPYSNPYGGGYDYDSFRYNSYLGNGSRQQKTFSVDNKEVLNCPR